MINAEQSEQRRFVDALRGALGMAPLYCLEDDSAPMFVLFDSVCRMVPKASDMTDNAMNHEKRNRRDLTGRGVDNWVYPGVVGGMTEMQRRRYGY